MSVFISKLNLTAKNYQKNREEQLTKIEHMNSLCERAEKASAARKARFDDRGQLLPRERLSHLLDKGMPFLEMYNMANYCLDEPDPKESTPGASVIGGIGYIQGTRCMVAADDSGIAAGAATSVSFKKLAELMKVALDKKLPFVHLVESAGANLMKYQVEGWAWAGEVFYMLAKLSAAGVPTISILHGPSTAGGAYMPGMSDYNIGVKKNGMAALAGAALVRAATGEIADARQLGGTEMHAETSGLMEYLAENDLEAILKCRELIERLGWNEKCSKPNLRNYEEPLYDSEEILGLVPIDYKILYDARELAARIVDASDFIEFKSRYGSNLICLQARVCGHEVGIVGNNGPMGPNEATKGAQFFQLCDQAQMPIVFLNNITGFMVGTEYEQNGMIKHGAKMIQAVSNVRVPRITFYVGGSFGAGNYGMSGLGYFPSFLFTWPAACTGVMGGEQAAKTMQEVALASAKRKNIAVDKEKLAKQSEEIKAHFDKQDNAFYTSGRMLDQGMIDPRHTRQILGFTLQTLWEAKHRNLNPNSFGVARF